MFTLPPLTKTTEKIFGVAVDVARRYSLPEVSPIHFLFSTLRVSTGTAYVALKCSCGNLGCLERDICTLMDHGPVYVDNLKFSNQMLGAIENGSILMANQGRYACLSSVYVLWGVLHGRNNVSDLMIYYGVDDDRVLDLMTNKREP